jgi:hypothetical protein
MKKFAIMKDGVTFDVLKAHTAEEALAKYAKKKKYSPKQMEEFVAEATTA